MESSAGPMTRSRARVGPSGAAPSSAAPSTRKKAAPRSTRKSVPTKAPPASPPKPASNVEDVPVEDADDTAAAVDIPEASAQKDKAAPTPAGADAASDEPQGTPAPSGSTAINGLTPAGATPADFGPSPVMPIKLDSLWTPGTAQQDTTSPYAGFSPLVAQQSPEPAADAGADAERSGLTQETSGVDLAAMFISTPAGAPRSSSPIAGVVATEEIPAAAAAAPTAPQQQLETPSTNDSVLMGSPALPGTFAFAGLTPAAAGPSASSPAALPGADLGASGDAPQPSAPLLPPGGTPGTPGWSVDTELPPAGSPSMETLPNGTPAARLTPGSVRGGLRSAVKGTPGGTAAGGTAAKRTPGGVTAAKGTPGASLSPMEGSPLPPAGPPDFSDMESPLPPAMSPIMQEDETEPLPPAGSPMLDTEEEETLPPAGSPMLSLAGTPAAAAAAEPPLSSSTPAVVAEQAAAADAEMEMCAVQQQEAIKAEILQSVEAEAAMLEQQVQAIPTDSGSTDAAAAAEYSAEEVHAGFAEQQQQHGGYECDDDCMMGSEGAGEADVSMEADTAAAADATADSGAMELSFGSPAGAVAAGDSPTPICFPAAGCTATPHSTPAAAGVKSPGVTSPGARYRSSSAKTAAPPKSALAKPKSGSSSAAPKHAHVVVPDAASPKTTPPARSAAGRSAPGSAAARFTDGQKQQAGGSPGHTPFPSKAKVRAATAAATAAAAGRTAASSAAGTAATAAAGSKGPSHKKEMALAAAHSALKRYSKAVAEAEGPEAATPSPTAGTSVRRSSTSPSPSTIPNVSSRLMQPTASSSAKTRYSGASDQPDALMWSPPSDSEAPIAAAAAAGSSRPRLASKIVVPSPVARDAAADPSIKALKRSIKSKVAEKARVTVREGRADTLGADAVRSSKLVSDSSKAEKAARKAAAEEEDLDLDYEDYEADYYEDTTGEVDALADTLAGLSVKPVNVAQPKGPLKGVAAPVGRHFKFDESGKAQETPMSRQRRAPTHIKFDDEGNPVPAQKLAPRWR